MTEIIYGDVKQYIDELAKSLGVAAEYVFELLVRQQIIFGAVEVFSGVILIAILIASIKFVYNVFQKAEYSGSESLYIRKPINVWAKIKESDFVDYGFIWGIFGFIWLVLIAIIAAAVPEGIMRILNPEYYAIKEILDVIKGGR